MKNRYFLLNLAIIVLFSIVAFGYYNYAGIKDLAIGKSALKLLEEREKVSLEKISGLQLSVYSIKANELNQVRSDIMTKFEESDFVSITIQPKAAFIDSLLFDSKLKQYMANSNLKKTNKSLLNKMKLYLPNELLVSFLANGESINQIFSIEEYLVENGYSFISGTSIPTVKSTVKHYYYDKYLFNDLVIEFADIAQHRNFLLQENAKKQIMEISILLLLCLLITTFIQLIDFYLQHQNREKIKFLLKGHLNPRIHQKRAFILKSFILIFIIVSCILELVLKLTAKLDVNLQLSFIIFICFTATLNLLIFILKKERIEL